MTELSCEPLVQRTRIVLLTADGHSQREVTETLGCNVKTVREWQGRWMAEGFKGIGTERPGRGQKAWVLPNVSQEPLTAIALSVEWGGPGLLMLAWIAILPAAWIGEGLANTPAKTGRRHPHRPGHH